MTSSAIIFDLDGTIINDEKIYENAFRNVLVNLGVKPKKNFPHIPGIGVRENWPKLIDHYKIKTKKTIDELATETQREYLSEFKNVQLNEGVLEFIQKAKSEGQRLAIATTNNWTILERVYDKFHIEKYFDASVTREEVYQTKPSPEIFLKVADKLDIAPQECLVIEDAVSGVEAAHAAGMRVIALAPDKIHEKQLKDADIIIKSFNDLLTESFEI